ncbi:phage tail protein [Synechococcus sp. PCC 7336]|uniref:phage tail protein n=1 Tax=Synechococcus sp. PCC 7336 TaxID=195250 RepID=UPI0003656B79|nr:phage tail protein [Synechococcus sp. PCC 7336]
MDGPPALSFFFSVSFRGGGLNADTSFQSVTGLSVDMQTETLKEGGENRFEHILPVRTKYSPLVLKRGLIKDSKLIAWASDAILNFDIQPLDLQVQLLHQNPPDPNAQNRQVEPLVTWKVIGAWPKKWSVSEFNAEQSSLVIETLELNYQYFKQ